MRTEPQTLTEKAMAAMENAIRKVIEDHRRQNRPLATWENGEVVYRDPNNGHTVRESTIPYGNKSAK